MMGTKPRLSIVVAMDSNRAIGKENRLLCHLPADLKHFKALTLGHTVIMGRKTFESLPKGALPDRRNLVLTRNADYKAQGATCYGSLEQALKACGAEERLFIIGGAEVYQQALPLADAIYMTVVDHLFEGADTFFPPFSDSDWVECSSETHEPDQRNGFKFMFVFLIKKRAQ